MNERMMLKPIYAHIIILFFSLSCFGRAVIGTDILPIDLVKERNDPYLNFQWGFINFGQVVNQQKSGLEFEAFCGTGFSLPSVNLDNPSVNDFFLGADDKNCQQINQGAPYKSGDDINWKYFVTKLESQLKRDVVVAVLDSGLDTSHLDIKNNLARIDENCDAEGEPIFVPQIPEKGKRKDKSRRDRASKRSKKLPSIDKFDFSLDCYGWNFTKKDVFNLNNVFDDSAISHGTHIAGILAAEGNNGEGVAGLSNRIKVLPVKVFRSFNNNEANKFKIDTEFSELSDTVALGLEYLAVAIKNGRTIDAVNMSFGWPKKLTTTRVKKALQALIDMDVVMVAAAGNDDINVDLFPCAYPGVICVGAHTNTGKISSYSNYGSSVDILAPGDSILSLSRTDEISRLFSQSDNYDFLSGTSQAAPMVAGIAALIRGHDDSRIISANEVKARILAYTKTYVPSEGKYTLTGITQLSSSLKSKERPFLYPDFKDKLQTQVINNTFNLEVTFNNLWKRARNIKIEVSAVSPFIKLNKKQFIYNQIDEFVHLGIKGQLDSLNISSVGELLFKLSYQSEVGETYTDEFKLTTDLFINLNDAAVKSIPLLLSQKVKETVDAGEKLGSGSFDLGRRLFQQVRPTQLLSESTEYYVANFVDENGESGIEALLLKPTHKGYEQKRLAFLPNSRRYQVFKLDLYPNYPGQEYIIRSEVDIVEEDNESEQLILKDKYVEFHVVSSDLTKKIDVLRLKPRAQLAGRNYIELIKNFYFDFTLFGLTERVTPDFTGFKKDLSKLYRAFAERPKLLHNPHSDVNHLFFLAEGFLSDLDNTFDLNSFSQSDFASVQLYYLEKVKDQDQLQVRTLSTPQFKQNILNQFANYFYNKGFISSPRVHPDMQMDMWKLLETNNQKQVSLLVSFSMESEIGQSGSVVQAKGINTNYFFIVNISFDDKGELVYSVNPLEDFAVGLSFDSSVDDILTYFSINDGTEGNLIGVKNFKFTRGKNSFLSLTDRSRFAVEEELEITSPQQDEFLNVNGNLVSYKNGDRYFNFYRTLGELLLTSSEGEEVSISTQAIKVTQFLPGINFREVIIPSLYKAQELTPAIYVNASEIFNRRVYSYVIDRKGELIAPVNLNIEVPKNCYTALTSKYEGHSEDMYTFLCKEKSTGDWAFKLVPVAESDQ